MSHSGVRFEAPDRRTATVWDSGGVQVRPSSVPDEPEDTPSPEPAGEPADHADAGVDATDSGPAAWLVPTRTILAKSVITAVFVIFAIALGAPERWIAVLIAAGLAAYTLRDVTARERLRADAEGVVVARGYFGRRRLAWSELDTVRVDERTRFGAEVYTLELDADDEIYLLSRHDLGADPREVRRRLNQLGGRPDEPDGKPEDEYDWDDDGL
jgi:hypothetical protein